MQLRSRSAPSAPRPAVGRRIVRGVAAGLATTLATALIAAALLLPSSADASGSADPHDEVAPHRLDRQVLCLDATSVRVRVEDASPDAADALRARLLRDVAAMLPADLRGGGVALRDAACRDADAFVSVELWVTRLDGATYRAYRDGAYGLGATLQVGAWADPTGLDGGHLLPDLRFDAFAETVVDPRGAGPIDRYAVTMTRGLVTTLVEAWRHANP